MFIGVVGLNCDENCLGVRGDYVCVGESEDCCGMVLGGVGGGRLLGWGWGGLVEGCVVAGWLRCVVA